MSTSEERLIAEAEALSGEIEGGLLAFASPDARLEWDALRARRFIADDEALPIIVSKLRRFRAILGSLSERYTSATAS